MAWGFPDKSTARQWVWDRLAAEGVARFPFPPHGRIPNIAGAELAPHDSLTSSRGRAPQPSRSIRRSPSEVFSWHAKRQSMAMPRLASLRRSGSARCSQTSGADRGRPRNTPARRTVSSHTALSIVRSAPDRGGGYGMSCCRSPRKVTYFEPVPPRLGRTVSEFIPEATADCSATAIFRSCPRSDLLAR